MTSPLRTALAALLAALALTASAMAENLDVSVITVKKFTVNDHGGIVMPARSGLVPRLP
jgi:Spy/CpxP family protein refolding chaperone